ncbi:hypothetical protein IFM89_026126 [Coptis chinensis]|uniref:NPH3 domain-containing protein n=1 Tax=Coptis chinensis TaxID=261450 RepID=A0A835IDQ9_9MAGN|nr:hypothetical protein IFM89_026126 [Coptis chinensis]
MAINGNRELYRVSNSEFLLQLPPHVHGTPLTLDKRRVVARSRKLFNLVKDQQNDLKQLPYTLPDIPGNLETFELAMKFCYGYELSMTTENVIPLICLAYYLEMTDEHSPDNLLNIAISFFNHNVLTVWHQTLKALPTTEQVNKQAMHLRIVDFCLDSLVRKARVNPFLIGEPIKSHIYNHGNDHNVDSGYNRASARRRLFLLDCQSDGITMLSLQLYGLLMSKMILEGIRPDFIAASLFRYTKRWIHEDEEGSPSTHEENYQREIIETVEKLLSIQIGVLPCKLLFEMLRTAMLLEASTQCRYGFENRIGRQLIEATVEDLLIPFQGYACEVQYDTECVKRILKAFYSNYTSSDQSGLIKVADLIDDFLAVVAKEFDMNKDTFMSLLKLSAAASNDLHRTSDGMYHAIDVYLNKHKYNLTESEREEVCQLLDCNRMSSKACTHAAQNERLPLRVVVQTLFVGQLQLRDAITSRIGDSENRVPKGGDGVGWRW